MRQRGFVALAAAGALVVTGSAVASGSPGAGASGSGPTQTIFASGTQGVGSLYLLVTVHKRARLQVTASAGRYHYSSFRKSSVPPHIPSQVRLRLSGSALRSARKALRRHRMTATVRSTARDSSGSRTYTKRIKLRR